MYFGAVRSRGSAQCAGSPNRTRLLPNGGRFSTNIMRPPGSADVERIRDRRKSELVRRLTQLTDRSEIIDDRFHHFVEARQFEPTS